MRTHHTKESVSIEDRGYITAEEFYKETFGDFPKGAIYLAGLRYREDLTQQELGKMLAIKQSNISMMERGLRPIGKVLAKKLGKFFDTDYRKFL
jgi:DNA-binding XRE family transcriptional regulator